MSPFEQVDAAAAAPATDAASAAPGVFGPVPSAADRAEHTAALGALGTWAAQFSLDQLSPAARTALDDLLANMLAVTVGGAATAEQVALVDAWDPEPGACTLWGTARTATVEVAAWLNGVASVSMERDSGNRLTHGHPAAMVFPAVLALAERLGSDSTTLLTALAVGHEVAARFGRATAFAPTVHSHGTFGVPGAAAGCALLLGLDATGISQAIDAGCALPIATSWGPVLGGSSIRDQWIGAGNTAGIAAARYAASGRSESIGGTLPAFGGTLGSVDIHLLIRGLGTETLLEHGYLKKHSSCAYTHSPIDAALDARRQLAELQVDVGDITSVEVATTAAGAALDSTTWTTRHGAFFSVPFAVASALTHGDVAYARSAPDLADELYDLAARITVIDGAAVLTADGPTHRPARVTLGLTDGTVVVAAVPHARGDIDLSPFDWDEQQALLDDALLESPGITAADIAAMVQALGADATSAATSTATSHFSLLRTPTSTTSTSATDHPIHKEHTPA
jgi:2-methylcitrate dehydratase PrpD